MIDLPAVRLSGAIEIARARVLWFAGILRAFTKDGLVFETISDKPVPQRAWLSRQWTVRTIRGDITIKARCPTCGGWRKVTKPTAEELWRTA